MIRQLFAMAFHIPECTGSECKIVRKQFFDHLPDNLAFAGFDTKKEFVLFFPADRRRWIGRLIKETTVCMGNTYRLHIQCFPALRISSVQFRKIFVNCADPHQWIGRKMFQPRKKIV